MGTDIRALAASGVLVLVLGALVAATSDGAAWFGLGSGSESSSERQAEDDGLPQSSGEGSADEAAPGAPAPPRSESAPWVRALAIAVLGAIVVACLLAFAASFRLKLRRRRLQGGRVARTVPGAYVDGDPPGVEEESLQGILAARLANLGEGTPRNAIVAAWVQLEEFAGRQGLPRQESDTPAEFVARTLAAYALDEAAGQRLAELYREARFSQHPLTESHRDEARRCLERLVGAVGIKE